MPTHHLKVNEENDKLRLDVYLTQNLHDGQSRTYIKKLIEHGHVRVNENLVKPHHSLASGDDVLVEIPANFLNAQYVEPQDIPLNIFYENEYFLIINKPQGMLVHPAVGRNTGTLVNALLYKSVNLSDFSGQLRPGIVHRLDQETSGLILIAKDNITHTKLAKQFQRRIVKKQYVALVEGSVEFDEGVINVPIGRHPKHRDKKTVRFDDAAKTSKTTYKVLRRATGITLIALYPHTGRTHQLRVHMRYLGHSILGDDKYGKKSSFNRLALHAQALGFYHPVTKRWMEFVTVIPPEFCDRVAGRNT